MVFGVLLFSDSLPRYVPVSPFLPGTLRNKERKMESFTFQNPTKIIFGRGTEDQVGNETKPFSGKTLLHYGGGSVRKSGLLDRVLQSLENAGIEVFANHAPVGSVFRFLTEPVIDVASQ